MKKKKLKKRIKKLEKESQMIIDKTTETLNAQHQILCALRDRISTLDDSITKNDQSYRSQFGTIKNSVREIRNMVNIAKQRTETDYTQFKPLVDTSKGPDTVSKTCNTCLYNGMGLDGPCMGCTAEDLKMYKQKEN